MAEFLTYQKFFNKEDAEAFASFLDANFIMFELERQRAVLDPIYIGEQSEPTYVIKVKADQFEKVNALVKEEAGRQLENVPADYYLFEFSDAELKNVLKESEEWNQLDVLLAEKLLKERGVKDIAIPLDTIVAQYQPARIGTLALVAGYVCCFLFPVYSIPMGVVVVAAKKTFVDGTKMHLYDKWSRDHGFAIAALGTVLLILAFYGLNIQGGRYLYR